MSDDLIRRSDAIEVARHVAMEVITADGRQMLIESIPSADKWIPCSERLPKEKEIVLITNDKGNVRFGQFRGTHGKYWIWKGNTLETVLAWQPLPPPWKGADDE